MIATLPIVPPIIDPMFLEEDDFSATAEDGDEVDVDVKELGLAVPLPLPRVGVVVDVSRVFEGMEGVDDGDEGKVIDEEECADEILDGEDNRKPSGFEVTATPSLKKRP